MIKKILAALLLFPTFAYAQINTDRVMMIARNALYFEDYVLSIQYFNQVINAKPYLYEPYFFRGLAKINLDDYQGLIRFVGWQELSRINTMVQLRIIKKRSTLIRRILLFGTI